MGQSGVPAGLITILLRNPEVGGDIDKMSPKSKHSLAKVRRAESPPPAIFFLESVNFTAIETRHYFFKRFTSI